MAEMLELIESRVCIMKVEHEQSLFFLKQKPVVYRKLCGYTK